MCKRGCTLHQQNLLSKPYDIGRRKLRCPRNMLHMHLFMSFMMRALMALLRDIIFVAGIGLPSDIVVKNGESYWLADSDESNWHCKAFTSFWQYFILANYSWILMEGLYLHNLVFLALFRDANSSIFTYVVLGWGEFIQNMFCFPPRNAIYPFWRGDKEVTM